MTPTITATEEVPVPSPISIRSEAWVSKVVMLGATSIIIGILWDISWHRTIGRDTFWTPAHMAIYLGGLLGGLTATVFEMRAEGRAPLKIGSSQDDPICKLSEFEAGTRTATPDGEISFPYSFSQSGPYRLWVQIKVSGEIFTGVFDLEVAPGSMER